MTAQAPLGATRILKGADSSATLVLSGASVRVVRGPDADVAVRFERPRLLVGTDPGADFVLTDPAISGQHFEIALDESGALLRDLGSTNGTQIDGLRVREAYLHGGAVIGVGESQLVFSFNGDDVKIPLSSRTNFGALLGHSTAMRAAFAILEQAAGTESTLLIEGESGTGKELAARGAHELSPRSEGPYVVLDCGAVPATLIESHLFGHARGAFTGAIESRTGVFEQADGGTLVLDEIGELPLDLQPKLLRALEDRTIQRVGEGTRRPVDVRIIASTNRHLRQVVREKNFREDLYFRLSVIRVALPPLRERRDEIPRLVAHFLERLGADPVAALPPGFLALLMAHSWPGNVRELRNVVERFTALPNMPAENILDQDGARTLPDASPSPVVGAQEFHEAKRIYLERFERDYLAHYLAAHHGNISEVARVSGLSRQSCHRLIRKYQLDGV